MSGRDQASGAGERSSVFVSPGTLNTVTVIFSGSGALELNHSPSAHDCHAAREIARRGHEGVQKKGR